MRLGPAFYIRALVVRRAPAAPINCALARAAGIRAEEACVQTVTRASWGFASLPPSVQKAFAPRNVSSRAIAALRSCASMASVVQVQGSAAICAYAIRNVTPAAAWIDFARSAAMLEPARMARLARPITRRSSASVHCDAWARRAAKPTIALAISVSSVVKVVRSARGTAQQMHRVPAIGHARRSMDEPFAHRPGLSRRAAAVSPRPATCRIFGAGLQLSQSPLFWSYVARAGDPWLLVVKDDHEIAQVRGPCICVCRVVARVGLQQ